MSEEENKVRARIRTNEQLAYEYETIGDLEGSSRCKARVPALKSGLARRKGGINEEKNEI